MRLFLTSISLFFSVILIGQDRPAKSTGTISYVSSQHIYVKFESTDRISVGDTLFMEKEGRYVPALLVNNKSSISCVCTPLTTDELKKAETVVFREKEVKKVPEPSEKKQPDISKPPEKEKKPALEKPVAPVAEQEEELEAYRQKVRGRLSVASYSSMTESRSRHRMRYAFSFRGQNLNQSRFSFENYITFRHTAGEWEDVKENLNDAIKVYSFAVKYDLDRNTNLTLGRKINPKISSMGAIDGLQFEKTMGNFILGALGGSRPDFSDYGINPSLFQAGAYLGYVSDNAKKYHQSTFAVVEQRNHSNTDRRFIYFQHSNTLLEDLNMFTSFEFDLYENIHEVEKNKISLTNLFASLRYRISKNFRVSASYDTRKNIIFYESYKNFIDQLIEDQTRQGLRMGFNVSPFRLVTWGANASWRFQKDNGNVSKNLNSYLSISRIPGLNMRASLTANFLQTGYLDSRTLGIRLSKDIFSGKVNTDLYYRMVDYTYKNSEYKLHQNIAGLNVSIRLLKKLSLHLYYEGTFNNNSETLTRFNTKIIQRF